MTTRYLPKEYIIEIHRELIDRFGGLQGIRDESLLESAVGRYKSGYYADAIEEAAALMESLGGNHPFIDGNKRIAVTAPFTFLMVNGYEVLLDEKEAFDFINNLFEAHEFSFAKIEPWIRANARKEYENLKSVEPTYSSYSMKAVIEPIRVITTSLKKFKHFLIEWTEKIEGLTSNTIMDKSASNELFEELAIRISSLSLEITQAVDKCQKRWITATEWDETHIPTSESLSKLQDEIELLQDLRSSMVKFQDMNDLLDAIYPLKDTNEDLHLAMDYFAGTVKGVFSQFEVMIYRCNYLVELAERRIMEIKQDS